MPFPLPALPPVEVMLFSLGIGLGLLAFLAACCGPFLAVVSEWLSVTKGRSFYKKAARQLSLMSLFLGTVIFCLFAAALVFLVREQPELMQPPYLYPLLTVAGMAALGELFLLTYVLSWNPQKKASFFHAWLGIKAGGCAAVALFLGTGFLRRIVHTPPESADGLSTLDQLISFFSIPLNSLFWPLLVESIALGCAAAGALGAVWLLMLRNRQDYGRDYYNFALPYCAKWAIAGTITALPLAIVLYFQAMRIMLPELSHDASLPLLVAACALPLLSSGLWTAVCKSPTPLRHKISIVIAALCLVVAVGIQVYTINKMLPSP